MVLCKGILLLWSERGGISDFRCDFRERGEMASGKFSMNHNFTDWTLIIKFAVSTRELQHMSTSAPQAFILEGGLPCLFSLM